MGMQDWENSMAKRQKVTQISASFHYFNKTIQQDGEIVEAGFSQQEFQRVIDRISNVDDIDFTNPDEVSRIKRGENLPFLLFEDLGANRFFGQFEGAYYGQQYRNTQAGVIDADSLNLRRFFYLIALCRDGKIVVGVQYTGNFGDFDGLRKCLLHLLRTDNARLQSNTFMSLRHEIGDGVPVEIKVNIRKQNGVIGGRSLFSRSGIFAIRRSDYGDSFADDVKDAVNPLARAPVAQRRRMIADLMSDGNLFDVDDNDIDGCSVLVDRNGRRQTVYILGSSEFATKFPVGAAVDRNGLADRIQVRAEMIRLFETVVVPGLV